MFPLKKHFFLSFPCSSGPNAGHSTDGKASKTTRNRQEGEREREEGVKNYSEWVKELASTSEWKKEETEEKVGPRSFLCVCFCLWTPSSSDVGNSFKCKMGRFFLPPRSSYHYNAGKVVDLNSPHCTVECKHSEALGGGWGASAGPSQYRKWARRDSRQGTAERERPASAWLWAWL